MLKRVLNFREWNLLAQVIWSGSLILVLLGLKEVFEASGLPDSVRYIAAYASVPVVLIGLVVMAMSSDAWARRKFGDRFGRGGS
jgi:hypothetical protein